MRELPFDLRFARRRDRRRTWSTARRARSTSTCSRTSPPRLYERLAAAEEADVLVFGHTHKPWMREHGGVLFVNCGSVGKPKDGDPRGAFAVLDASSANCASRSSASPTTPTRSPPRSAAPGCRASTPTSCSSLPEGRADEEDPVRLHPQRRALADGPGAVRPPRARRRARRVGRPSSRAARASGPRWSRSCASSASTCRPQRPKKLLPEMQLHADWAVTLACGANCPYVPTVVEDWDVPDPAGKTLDEVRAIRDQIELRVRDLVEQRLDEIRADRTAHQLRLAQPAPRPDRALPGAPRRADPRGRRRGPLRVRRGARALVRDDPGRPQGARAVGRAGPAAPA